MVATCSVIFMIFLDMVLYQEYGSEGAKGSEQRRMLLIRWSLIVLVPIEDFTMIGLAVFTFVNDTPEIWGILSIAASLMSVFFLQFCFVVCEANGLNTKIKESKPKLRGDKELIGLYEQQMAGASSEE